jgi:hypothetical protein
MFVTALEVIPLHDSARDSDHYHRLMTIGENVPSASSRVSQKYGHHTRGFNNHFCDAYSAHARSKSALGFSARLSHDDLRPGPVQRQYSEHRTNAARRAVHASVMYAMHESE